MVGKKKIKGILYQSRTHAFIISLSSSQYVRKRFGLSVHLEFGLSFLSYLFIVHVNNIFRIIVNKLF